MAALFVTALFTESQKDRPRAARLTSALSGLSWAAAWFVLTPASAADPAPKPRVLFTVPLAIVRGEPTKLSLRGTHLETTSKLVSVGLDPVLMLTPKSSKPGVPNGLDGKFVGDTHVETELTLPEASRIESLKLELELPGGAKTTRVIPVVEKAQVVEDKEPNNGFTQSQPLEIGKTVRGQFHQQKDVDVYRLDVKAGQTTIITVTAQQLGSPTDAMLMLFDQRGRQLASNDDTAGRDPKIEFTAQQDQSLLVSVNESNDNGGPLFGYLLTTQVKTTAKP